MKSNFVLIVAYALNTNVERQIIRKKFHHIQAFITSGDSNPPWTWSMLGDFNAYFDLEESLDGHRFWTTSMVEFKQCLMQLGVKDLRST